MYGRTNEFNVDQNGNIMKKNPPLPQPISSFMKPLGTLQNGS